MKETKLNPWLKKKFKTRVYEYYYEFDIFAEYLIDILDEVEKIDNQHQIMDCLYQVRKTTPNLYKLIVKRAKQPNCKTNWEYTKQIYNLIPQNIWENYYDAIEAFLSYIDEPHNEMAYDAKVEWLEETTMKDIDEKYCEKCPHKIKCALKSGKEKF